MAATESSAPIASSRLEALTDGIYAFALTLLVLDLKLPDTGERLDEAALRAALLALLPKALTWLLSFGVMASFWVAQARLYRLTAALTAPLLPLELLHLALIGLLPFTTSLMGAHGELPLAAALYSANLFAVALLIALRTLHLLAHPQSQAAPVSAQLARQLRRRAFVSCGCAFAALLLAWPFPGWNMLAMVGTGLLPAAPRGRG